MKRAAITLATLAFALAVALPVQAQTDFSGTWKLNAEKSDTGGRGGGRGGGMSGDIVVKQTAAELSVTRGEQVTLYKLDGSEITITGDRGNSTAKARVEGATIVIETTRAMNEMTMTTKATWAMEGGNLVITSVTATPNGDRTTKMVYDKQ